jgi:hypothetical protein
VTDRGLISLSSVSSTEMDDGTLTDILQKKRKKKKKLVLKRITTATLV